MKKWKIEIECELSKNCEDTSKFIKNVINNMSVPYKTSKNGSEKQFILFNVKNVGEIK